MDINFRSIEGYTESGKIILTKTEGYSEEKKITVKKASSKTRPIRIKRAKAKTPAVKGVAPEIPEIEIPAAPARMLGDNADYPELERLTANADYLTWSENTDEDEEPWVLHHNKAFETYIVGSERFKRYKLPSGKLELKEAGPDGHQPPFLYQSLIKNYIGYPSPYRGVLINHGLGSGKTRTAVMAAETYRRVGIPVMYFGPASLKSNFIEELLKWGDEDIRLPHNYAELSRGDRDRIRDQNKARINAGYKFISANASNVLDQLAALGIGFPDRSMNSDKAKNAAKKYAGGKLDYPNKYLIIMEEVHNVNRSFTSGSASILPKVYQLFENAVDCKFIALSATPIVNNPFEICTLFNLLRGKVHDDKGRKQDILPVTELKFRNRFVNRKTMMIDDPDKIKLLSKRLTGLVSYYRGIVSDRNLFPDIEMHDDIIVTMSPYQDKVHAEFLGKEATNKGTFKDRKVLLSAAPGQKRDYMGVNPGQKELFEESNSYRANSRASCNYVWPEDNPKPPTYIPTSLDFKDPEICTLHNLDRIAESEQQKRLAFMCDVFNIPERVGKERSEFDYENIGYMKGLLNRDDLFDGVNFAKILMTNKDTLDNKNNLVTMQIFKNYGQRDPLAVVSNIEVGLMDEKPPRVRKFKHGRSHTLPKNIKNALTTNGFKYYKYGIGTRDQNLEAAIQVLKDDADTYLSDDALEMYSPKMLTVFNNILTADGCMKRVSGPSSDVVPEVDQAEIVANEIIQESQVKDEFKKDKFDDVYDTNDLFGDEGDEFEDEGTDGLETITEEPQAQTQTGGGKRSRGGSGTPQLTDSATLSKLEEHRSLYTKDLLKSNGEEHIEGGPALVYSEFRCGEGVGIFKAVLEARGFEEFDPENYDINAIDSIEFKPRYVVISGSIDMETRHNILSFCNHPLNRHGQLITVVLVTSAASEGISLFHIRQVHIMEPFWHNTRINQVIGRARRIFSHKYLPDEQRNVNVYKYYSKEVTREAPSTDLALKEISDQKDMIITSIMDILHKASFDCRLNDAQNELGECFSLKGDTSGMAFTSNLETDTKTAMREVEKTVKVEATALMKKGKVQGYYKSKKGDYDPASKVVGKFRYDKIKNETIKKFLEGKAGERSVSVYPLYTDKKLDVIDAYIYIVVGNSYIIKTRWFKED